MTDHRKNTLANEPKEWLELETAVELIGQRIADSVLQYNQEKGKAIPDANLLSQLKTEILELGRERQACYQPETQREAIHKALTEYATKRKKAVWTLNGIRASQYGGRPKSRPSTVAGIKESKKI